MFYRLMTFADSPIATGTTNLLNDVLMWMYGIITVVGGVCAVYFFGRRSGADQQDKKTWDERIKTAILSTIGGLLITGIIQLLASYYSVG